MNKAFEKILERLEERKQLHERMISYEHENGTITEEYQARKAVDVLNYAKKIVQEVAEEYNGGWIPCSKRLPVKAGDTVYKPNPITLSEIVEIKIESIFITESKINISGRTAKMKYSFCCSPSDLGKTVFLTQAEAEQKLKEMESESE